MNPKISLAIAITFSINIYSFSQTPAELDPVTVIASLSAQKISRTGRNVVVIKGDEFNNLPVHSIDELLRYLPGVEIQVRGPMGSQSDIVLRGGTFQQVLVILDGVRLNDPITGHFSSYIPIAPSEIDRIEILKGASSAIYGSEAVGGVIQVITKSFAAKQSKSLKQLQAAGTVGEYGLINGNIGGNYGNGKTFISGGLLSNNSDGQLQRGTRGYFNNNTVSFSASQFFNKHWQLSLRSAYDKRKFSAQNFYTTFVSDTAKEEVKTFWNQIKLSYQKEKNKFILDAGYKQVQDIYAFNSGLAPNNNKSRLFQALAIYEHHSADKASLVTGMQFQNKIIRSNDRGNHDVKQAAAFVILNETIGNYFFASPAIRIDWDERGGTELVPQINLSYKKEKIQLRASAGKTIRQADFTERFNNYNKPFVSSGSIGYPDLKAERSFSYEAGVDYFVNNNLKVSATAFRREQKNVIDWTPTPYSSMPRKDNLSPTGNYALANNIAEVNTSGVETDVQYSKQFNHQQQVWATLGMVWLDSKTSETTPSFYISSHATFLTNFNVRYEYKRFSVSVNGVYKHRKQQSATAINAKVDANCFMLNGEANVLLLHGLSLFIEADNALDNKCSDLLGSQLPGRWLMGGLKLSIH